MRGQPQAAAEFYARAYLDRLTHVLAALDPNEIDEAIALIRRIWDAGGQIITFGNGGSAMTAMHFITDWQKMAFLATGRSFRGRSLIDNMGLITAYANDVSYADVFREQLCNLARPEDLVIAISGSGNSENVVRAVEFANELGCETLALSGFSGGKLRQIARHNIWVAVDDMQLVEDVHAIFGHIAMKALCGERVTPP